MIVCSFLETQLEKLSWECAVEDMLIHVNEYDELFSPFFPLCDGCHYICLEQAP